jgi:prepilin-type N-terminal cleavage/methylation domain-containing protein
MSAGFYRSGCGLVRSNGFYRRKVAFTLIELLVVIAILGILAGLLFPVLSKGKNRATMMVDVDNLKQQGLAMQLYVSDNSDLLPWPNWFGGDIAANGNPRPGWLYTLDPAASGPARFKVQTGVFWKTLRDARLYMCPLDYTNSPLFAERAQQISSYVVNGAVCGYERMLPTCSKISSLSPEAVSYWETDEQVPHDFNDGSSRPDEGVSARHLQGAMTARFEGSASYCKFDTWYDLAEALNKNDLWCYPNSPDGR